MYSGVEAMISHHPEHINMVKLDDGHTTLHVAVANNHLDIVCLLASMVGIDDAVFQVIIKYQQTLHVFYGAVHVWLYDNNYCTCRKAVI